MLFGEFFEFGDDVLMSEDCVDGGGVSRGCSAGAAEMYVLRQVRLYVLSGCDAAVRRHCCGILVRIECRELFVFPGKKDDLHIHFSGSQAQSESLTTSKSTPHTTPLTPGVISAFCRRAGDQHINRQPR